MNNNNLTRWWCCWKTEAAIKVRRIYLAVILHAWVKVDVIPSNSCWNIFVVTKVVSGPTHIKTLKAQRQQVWKITRNYWLIWTDHCFCFLGIKRVWMGFPVNPWAVGRGAALAGVSKPSAPAPWIPRRETWVEVIPHRTAVKPSSSSMPELLDYYRVSVIRRSPSAQALTATWHGFYEGQRSVLRGHRSVFMDQIHTSDVASSFLALTKRLKTTLSINLV